MLRAFLATVLGLLASTANAWTLQESVDAMSDKASRQVLVTAPDGSTFTLLRKTDGSVWGYLKITGSNQFMVNERLMMRIDKDKPIEFNEDLDQLMAKLGNPLSSWEWNPSLIGFRMWHGNSSKGCGLIKRLMESSTLVVRYHPNKSLIRDIQFNTEANRDLIGKALDLDVVQCVESR